MGMSIQQIDDQLLFVVDEGVGKTLTSDISSFLILGDETEIFLKPILDELRLKRTSTVRGQVTHLKALGQALVHLKITALPTNESDWQILILNIHHFVITRTDSKASLKSRICNSWLTIRGYLVILREEGIFPFSVYLPPVRETLDNLDISSYKDTLIGQRNSTDVGALDKIEKLIFSVSLARTDAEYLEEIRDTLATRRHLLFETLLGYWRQIKANFEFGRRLRDSVVWDDLKPLVENYPLGEATNHPANPRTGIQGLANYLAVILHEYDGCPPSDDDLRKKNREFEFLPRYSSILPISAWGNKYEVPEAPYGRNGWSGRNVLWWWQGRLSHFDVTMISALLIMMQPSWTPSSILLSKIHNKFGKHYLDLNDTGDIYEVEKPRAKDMKMEGLDPISYEIIDTLIKEGKNLRNDLRVRGDSRYSLLFLPYGVSKVAIPQPSIASSFLSGTRTKALKNRWLWIGMVYPELCAGGLSEGTLNFSKIRKTEGVLEWFRTKSLKAVSKKLGNTERIVLQHYIPKSILDAWNTRMIRRFQNLWISVAVANEDFLLSVTDFSSLPDLHAFLKDILQLHTSKDSPLSEMLHQQFDVILKGNSSSGSEISDRNSHLHVAISKATLSALYSYQAAVLHVGLSADALDKSDVLTGLSPRHFLSLADLLQSRLPSDKNPEYVACHEAAIQFASFSSERLNWFQLLRE